MQNDAGVVAGAMIGADDFASKIIRFVRTEGKVGDVDDVTLFTAMAMALGSAAMVLTQAKGEDMERALQYADYVARKQIEVLTRVLARKTQEKPN